MTWSDQATLQGWAGTGLAWLTGAADGPPRVGPGDPVGAVVADLAQLAAAARTRTGRTPVLPGVGLLTERAALVGLRRQAPRSAGGAFRCVATKDGHLGLSLARPEDVELVPALVESAFDPDLGDPDATRAWAAITSWASGCTLDEASARARLLGLPVAVVPAAGAVAPSAAVEEVRGARREPSERPLVVDLSALWAGPLCADLLRRTGAEVIKVESTRRPDGARRGSTEFFDLLHHGKQMVALDFTDPTDRQRLLELLHRADLVVEASRARALHRLGIRAEELVAAGTHWLSITAHGRQRDWVGFGDDVAVDAGLFVRDGDGTPMPVADAIADLLTGVAAAAAAARALTESQARLIEVTMWGSARAALARSPEPPSHAVATDGDRWWVISEGARLPVQAPRAREVEGSAAALGADTARWVR